MRERLNERNTGLDPDERPWLALYPQGVGPELALRHTDMLSAFDACVAATPDRVAVRYFDRCLTYDELDAKSETLATWFRNHGVGRGDRVAIVLQNVPAFVIAVVAAWKLGAAPMPGNPMYRAAELARVLSDSRPAAVICQEGDHAEMDAAFALAGLPPVPRLVVSPADGQGLNDARVLPAAACARGAVGFEDVIGQAPAQRLERPALGDEAIGLILYTSGTTGEPKGAVLSHRALLHNSQFMSDWCGLDGEDRILAMAPLFHITGFVCHLCAAIGAGCDMVLNYRFEPGVALDMIRLWRPTFTIGAITAFNALMRTPSITPQDMSCFTQIFSGGAPIPPALKAEIEAALGVTINPAYGMTETAAPVTFAPPGSDAPVLDDVLTIGVPIPGVRIRIVDDSGAVVGSGAAGEILISGPQVMTAYWRKPEATSATLRNGWLSSGDVGVMDDQGWVYLIDRKKDVIVASGFKVWPREVEDVLYAYPGVREAAVIGVPDAYRGETVKAFIALAAGVALDEADLMAHCRAHLAAYKAPRQIEIIAELPKTVTGKIQRVALRDW